jgi:hypothetical protein
MLQWRSLLLIGCVMLNLAACVPISQSQPTGAQAAELPVPTQERNAMATTVVGTAPIVNDPPEKCPVTKPPEPPFVPPAPYPRSPSGDNFWYGTESLWAALPASGVWQALPHNPTGYTQKLFWWRKGYSWTEEPEPELTVSGRRLDEAAPPLLVSKATNAYAPDIQSAMLVGVDFPTVGCWEIIERYAEAELIFVVWVAP